MEKFNKVEGWLMAMLKLKFDHFKELQDFIENHLLDIQTDIKQEWRKIENSQIPKEELDIMIGTNDFSKLHQQNKKEYEIGYQSFKFDHDFPNKIRYSTLIQTYSILEFYSRWLCQNIGTLKSTVFQFSDLKGRSDLEKTKLFLKRVYEIDFSKLEPEWGFINKMRKIRNQIVHHNGEFTKKDDHVYRIITEIEGLGILLESDDIDLQENRIYEIHIKSKELNEAFMNSIESFFQKLSFEIKRLENLAY